MGRARLFPPCSLLPFVLCIPRFHSRSSTEHSSLASFLSWLSHLFLMSLPIVFWLLFSLFIPSGSTATDNITAGQALVGHERLVSSNGKFVIGFFQTDSKSSQNTNWYLSIWFNKDPKLTPVWVANGDSPVTDPTLWGLTISSDGNLVILNQNTKSIVWSSQANITTNNTMAVLLNNGNLVLKSSNSSKYLWQSFEHLTNTFLPGTKIGRNKLTGMNWRLVSNKNLADPAPGIYNYELDPNGVSQLILAQTRLNSTTPYWYSGEWNGQYFSMIPEMLRHSRSNYTFVNDEQEEYFTFTLLDETLFVHHLLDVSGQMKTFFWLETSQDWIMSYINPKDPCDVYATCGPFTICDDNSFSLCNCMKGFSIRSQEDWKLDDRRSGCIRNTPLNCGNNKNTSSMIDKFYAVPCVRLPYNAIKIEAAATASECARLCLNNCSCTAYSYGNGGCSTWHGELLNVKQKQCSDTTNAYEENLYLRLAGSEVQSWEKGRKGIIIGAITGATVAALGLVALVLLLTRWRNKRNWSGDALNNVQSSSGIVAFRYVDLQRATKSFSERLGGGGFGSVFKGLLRDSTIIAVKRLDGAGAYQGEKQFRAEVSSIGIVQHINLVKLFGFCCEGDQRLLVYEHVANHSLDTHLFQNNATTLNWSTRYRIALGVARGLAYLHEECRDCIIHCDIKPQNILLDAMFVPKIADFGMAKLLGRDFSRVLTTIRGTKGYLAPEWISGVAITPKVDVYGYGMMLFEIISGRMNSSEESTTAGDLSTYFPVQVAYKLLEGDIDSLVDHKPCGDVNLKEVERACKVACWCIQDDELHRPTMGEVVRILEGLVEPGMPPMPRQLQAITGSKHPTSM